jgi:outer membrane protein OmpA-like peptidoglycan-associated protein
MSGLPLHLIQPKILIVLFCLARSAPVYAEDANRYEPFFVETAGQYYFSPGFFSEVISPGFGFRGAIGYEYNRFRFAVESGYNHITGTDPHVLELDFTPLVFKFGYALPLFSIVGLQADLNAGVAFLKTLRYPSAIDLAMDKVQEDRENSFITGGRLYATVTPLRFLRIYAGGGIDVILEKAGPLPLPLVEVGIHFKPFALAGNRPVEQPNRQEEKAAPPRDIIKVIISLPDIQFETDSAELRDSERVKLQRTGNILRNIPGVKIRVEGHTARAGAEEDRVRLSRQRAQAVASYLIWLEAVDASDVTVTGHGADRPVADNATAEGMSANRRVEIIILENQDGG